MGIFCRSFVMETAFPLEQALERLLLAVELREFQGTVSPKGFSIRRIISYNNSFRPQIRGRFEPSVAGTKIVGEMKMTSLGHLILVALSVPFVVLFILRAPAPDSIEDVMKPFALPLFFYLLGWIAFAAEARIARKSLSQLWESARGENDRAFPI